MFDGLYDNIGGKIKILAKWTFILEAVVAIIAGFFVLIEFGFSYAWWGVFLILLGPIIAWVSSWLLYALGTLVENSDVIRDELSYNKSNTLAENKSIMSKPDSTDRFARNLRIEPAIKLKRVAKLNHTNQCVCGEMFQGRFCPICGKSANK